MVPELSRTACRPSPVASLSIASFAGTVNAQDVSFFGFVITQKRWPEPPKSALPTEIADPEEPPLPAAAATAFASTIAPATASTEDLWEWRLPSPAEKQIHPHGPTLAGRSP